MAKYLEMDKTGCFQKNPLGTSYEASQELAATGKTLGIVQGNWVIALLKEKNPNGTFTLKALPATDDPAQHPHARPRPAPATASTPRRRTRTSR